MNLHPACDAGDPGLIPALGRSPGEGNENLYLYLYLYDIITF